MTRERKIDIFVSDKCECQESNSILFYSDFKLMYFSEENSEQAPLSNM